MYCRCLSHFKYLYYTSLFNFLQHYCTSLSSVQIYCIHLSSSEHLHCTSLSHSVHMNCTCLSHFKNLYNTSLFNFLQHYCTSLSPVQIYCIHMSSSGHLYSTSLSRSVHIYCAFPLLNSAHLYNTSISCTAHFYSTSMSTLALIYCTRLSHLNTSIACFYIVLSSSIAWTRLIWTRLLPVSIAFYPALLHPPVSFEHVHCLFLYRSIQLYCMNPSNMDTSIACFYSILSSSVAPACLIWTPPLPVSISFYPALLHAPVPFEHHHCLFLYRSIQLYCMRLSHLNTSIACFYIILSSSIACARLILVISIARLHLLFTSIALHLYVSHFICPIDWGYRIY